MKPGESHEFVTVRLHGTGVAMSKDRQMMHLILRVKSRDGDEFIFALPQADMGNLKDGIARLDRVLAGCN